MSSVENRLLDALGGRYRIDRELGGGGMSRVFVAEETRFGRTVVIKVLTHELAAGLSAERFEREIKLAAQLQQANIVPVIDAGEIAPSDGDPTLPYYTMPYVDGESLRARLIASAPLAVGESVAIMRDVARALAYAHAHGVIHRDIKPENVLLSGGAAVVTDFGIAKAVSASKTQAPGGTLTVIGTSLGTPAYMAPEQAVGGATDARADIYAWGIVAYELLAGAHPFAGKVTAQQFVAAQIAEAPAPLAVRAPGVPRSLGALVMRCIEKDPDARVASAAELVAVLESPSLLETPSESRPSSVGDRRYGNPPHPRHGRRVLTGALAITLVIGAAIAAWKYVAPADGVAHGAALADPANERASHAITTVAVLPFVNNGGTASDEYFSDGMTDELAHALSRVPSLRVAGRTSSYAFKGKDVPAQQIGRTLNVGGIVEGTLQRSGDRLRITAQLTSAKDGLVVWSDTYESRATDVFQVQDQFTKQIVQALEPALRGTAAATVADSSRGTTDLAAYDLYLKGRFFWEKRGGANLLRSIGYFKQSIARDPHFARAYAGLSMAYAVLPDYVPMDPDSLGGLAIASARHALTLDSTLADAHIALCGAGSLLMRVEEMEPQCRAALAIAPDDPTALQWHATSLSWLGRIPEALSEARRAAALDPLSPVIVATVDQALYASRDFRGALNAAREAIALDSSFTPAYLDIAMAEMFTGHADSAVTAMEMARRRDPSLPNVQGDLVLAYAAAGRWSDAERVRAAIQAAHARRVHHSGDTLSLDDLDAALAFGIPPAQRATLIQRIDWESVQAGGTFGLCVPIFDSLRAEPAFIAAERRMGASVCPYATPWPIQPRT